MKEEQVVSLDLKRVDELRGRGLETKIASERAEPLLDLGENDTGWRSIPLGQIGEIGVRVVSKDGFFYRDFRVKNEKSGAELLEVKMLAGHFAVDHPYVGEIEDQDEGEGQAI